MLIVQRWILKLLIPVINMMEEQKKNKMMGGTMRLGAYPCEIKEGSLAHKIYNSTSISVKDTGIVMNLIMIT